MKIPTKIVIFGQEWSIKQEAKPTIDGGECDGWAKSGHISLCKSLPADYKREVFLHELGHALFERVGIRESDIDHNLEEIIVQNFAVFINETFDLKLKV